MRGEAAQVSVVSNKIILNAGLTGRIGGAAGGLYAVIYNSTGAVYDVTTAGTFTSIASITWSNADVQLTEQGSTGQYQANFPTGIAAGLYAIEYREQAGASPNVLNDKTFGGYQTYWDGTNQREAAHGPIGAESYAADGAEFTLSQGLYMIYGMRQAVVSGTSFLVKGLDGTTTKMTFTMDDANNPTQMIRTA